MTKFTQNTDIGLNSSPVQGDLIILFISSLFHNIHWRSYSSNKTLRRRAEGLELRKGDEYKRAREEIDRSPTTKRSFQEYTSL